MCMCFPITTYIDKFSSYFIYLLPCNPCMVINITSLQTIRPNTFLSVNFSAQRDGYFEVSWFSWRF